MMKRGKSFKIKCKHWPNLITGSERIYDPHNMQENNFLCIIKIKFTSIWIFVC